MRLSVLDQAPVTVGHTGQEAIQYAVELAQEAENLGYHRMWMAEHHNTEFYASAAPEVIVSHIAAKTSSIRLGTGGVMLMHYSPYKLAEVFKTLSALAPSRIDFGAGRAPGGDHTATYALANSARPNFSDQYDTFSDTLKLLNDEPEETSDDRFKSVFAGPSGVELPEAWLLGSSGNSAREAGSRGVGYSFAQFFMLGAINEGIFDAYRDAFKPSPYLNEPDIMVAYLVTVAKTEEEAIYRARPQDITLLGIASGRMIQVPRAEDAAKLDLSPQAEASIEQNRPIHLVGTAKQVADKLRADQKKYGFHEAMICSIAHFQEERLETYRLLAEEML